MPSTQPINQPTNQPTVQVKYNLMGNDLTADFNQ